MNFRGRESDVQLALGNVKSNDVSIRDRRNRAAVHCFRRNVTSHQAVGGAGESAVGQKRHGITQAFANQCGGHGEHFAHAGAALRAFVANHNDVTGFNRSLFNRSEGRFFAVENASGAAESL